MLSVLMLRYLDTATVTKIVHTNCKFLTGALLTDSLENKFLLSLICSFN